MVQANYVIVGRQLFRKHPEMALQLLNEETQEKKQEIDYLPGVERIIQATASYLNTNYNSIANHKPFSRESIKIRRIVLGVYLKAYQPEAITVKDTSIKNGIYRPLIGYMAIRDGQHASELARYVIFQYKFKKGAYSDFSQKVDEIYASLIQNKRTA